MTDSAATLAGLRKRAGMTQLQVAEKMGVTKGRITQIEADYPDLMYPVVLRYLEALGARVHAAVGDTGVNMSDVHADPRRRTTQARRTRHQSLRN